MSEQRAEPTGSSSEPPNEPRPRSGSPLDWGSFYGSGQVHLAGTAFCAAAVILFTKLSSLLSPFNLYFTFSDLITSSREGYNPLPFLIKVGIPFAVGMVFYSLFRRRDVALKENAVAQPDFINLELTAQAGAGFAALLLAWPAIVLWEFVVKDPVLELRLPFLLIYVLYIVAFAYLCCAGVIIARLAWTYGLSAEELPKQIRYHRRGDEADG